MKCELCGFEKKKKWFEDDELDDVKNKIVMCMDCFFKDDEIDKKKYSTIVLISKK